MDDFIVATYLTTTNTTDPLLRAGAMAIEQTTGTWARVPDETDEVRRNHVGRVISCYNVPSYELGCPSTERTFIVQIPVEELQLLPARDARYRLRQYRRGGKPQAP